MTPDEEFFKRLRTLERGIKDFRIVSGDPRLSIQGGFGTGFAVNVNLEPEEEEEPGELCYRFTDPGNWWGAVFWPTYDVAPPGLATGYYHFCLRGLTLDFDRDANTVSNIQGYDTIIDNNISKNLVDPTGTISWWFSPSAAALDEIIAMAEAAAVVDGISFNVPTTGVVSLTLWIEMHHPVYYTIHGPPDRVKVGTETDSIPSVIKICYAE